MKLSEFIQESNGRYSSVRVMSIIALFVAIYITIFTNISIDILIVWITAAFAPKVIQKFAEKRG